MLCFNCFDTALLGMGDAALRENRMLADAQRAAYDRDGFIAAVPDSEALQARLDMERRFAVPPAIAAQ
jgi:hypothetical protein